MTAELYTAVRLTVYRSAGICIRQNLRNAHGATRTFETKETWLVIRREKDHASRLLTDRSTL
jgi:hypothetical protein